MAYLLAPLDMVLLSTLVRIVGLSGRAFGADPTDGGAEGSEEDAPRAATASSDVSYGVDGGNPADASPSSSFSQYEASEQASRDDEEMASSDVSYGVDGGNPADASPSSSFSQYEASEQASRDDEEMATLTLPTRPFAVPTRPFAVPNPYATPSHKQPNPIRAERRPTPEPTRPTLEQIRRSESNSLAALHRRRTLATPEPTRPTPVQSRRMEANRVAACIDVVQSWHNKTRLAEAPFGLVGDDNGPGSEQPPRNRFGIATAFMPSRRWSLAAPGKPSFPRFKGTKDRATQHRTEAFSGPGGDVNWHGSEPQPHDRFRYVSTFVTSLRRPPAAVGKPSFAFFSVDYLLDDVRTPWPETPESKESGHRPGVDGDGFLRYRLGWEPILAVKVIIVRTVVARLGKERPSEQASRDDEEMATMILPHRPVPPTPDQSHKMSPLQQQQFKDAIHICPTWKRDNRKSFDYLNDVLTEPIAIVRGKLTTNNSSGKNCCSNGSVLPVVVTWPPGIPVSYPPEPHMRITRAVSLGPLGACSLLGKGLF
ncbi:hypothetical protein THAOC_10445 [Thalassiosira oceanica]|uniref:Uncharacterized protein n=1 Tax=Thalassiosira oceanica TaxID=159749 RepID=K0STQ8_THAOC|nr:hypothetical protein THAOC_10445 [Thalassiosira oceanica]|eukprot:EJK68379.1 hypothetical protein THAOC_10445 [Thalassiosira oceanica]